MKKTKYLALVLVVAIMMMGAGYAWWTDTLTIDTTVTTGEFDVNFIKIIKEHVSPQLEVDPEIVDGNNVTVTIDNMYPNSEARHTYRIKNDGSIDANLDAILVVSDDQNTVPINMEIMLITPDETIRLVEGRFPDGTILERGKTMDLRIAFRLDYSSGNETQGGEANYNLSLLYKQEYPKANPVPQPEF